jgi:hypothetical protein
VVGVLLSVTFACGVVIAVAHLINRRFVAPVYDVVANLTAFGCAVAASVLLGHWLPAALSGFAIGCWLVLGRRTARARRPEPGPRPRASSPATDARSGAPSRERRSRRGRSDGDGCSMI